MFSVLARFRLGSQSTPWASANANRVRIFTTRAGCRWRRGADLLKDESRWNRELKPYVVGVISHFRDDKRVLILDLMNVPVNDSLQYKDHELADKADVALRLLKQEWKWARSAHPSQPLTSGVWKGDWSEGRMSMDSTYELRELRRDCISIAVTITPEAMKARIASLKRFKRPLICTEYMARPLGSTFSAILPILKQENVGGYNWGFVSGKTQTIYPWDSWEKAYTAEPPVWFHDIFHADGTPYDSRETDFIRQITRSAQTTKL